MEVVVHPASIANTDEAWHISIQFRFQHPRPRRKGDCVVLAGLDCRDEKNEVLDIEIVVSQNVQSSPVLIFVIAWCRAELPVEMYGCALRWREPEFRSGFAEVGFGVFRIRQDEV